MPEPKDRYTAYEKRKQREGLLRRLMPQGGEEGSPGGIRHSSSYHSYFEGYAEMKRLDEKGRMRVERIYAGPYYHPRLISGTMGGRKLLYVCLWLASLAGLLSSALPSQPVNRSAFSVIPTVASLFALVLVGRSVYNYCVSSEKMTLGQYRASSERLIRWSLIGAACEFAVGAGIFIGLILSQEGSGPYLLPVPALLGGSALLGLFFSERSTVYEKLPNPVELPSDAVLIE